MAGVNKVILVGNLGRDPEMWTFEDGTKKASFSLATTESYKDKAGNRVDQTEWHNIVLWRGLADIADRFLKKGNSVYIEGKIKTRSYQDKEGNTKYVTEIFGDNMTMLGSKNSNSSEGGTNTTQQQTSSEQKTDSISQTTEPDDLPF